MLKFETNLSRNAQYTEKAGNIEMLNRLSRNSTQKGASLFEIIILAGIIGLIYSGLSVLINRALDNLNTNTIVQNAAKIQIAVLQVYGTRGTFPDVGTDSTKIKEFRDNMIKLNKLDASDFENPFGAGDLIDLITMKKRSIKNRAFAIRIVDLDANQCRLVASQSMELFEFVHVSEMSQAEPSEIWASAEADKGVGVIKSPNIEAGVHYDPINVDHLENLCPDDDKTYRIMLGTS